jgi:hypothetical protein
MSTAALHRTNIGDEFVADSRLPYASTSRVTSFRQMKDTDPMPFGPYRSQPIGEVPASYLDHLRDANWLSKWPAVEEYITRNAKAIDKELDGPRARSDEDDGRPSEFAGDE